MTYFVPLAFVHINKDVKPFQCKEKAIIVHRHFTYCPQIPCYNPTYPEKWSCKFNGPVIKQKGDTLDVSDYLLRYLVL